MFLQRETSHSSLWLSSTLLCICISYKYISCLPGGCNTVFLLVSCCFDCCIFVVWCEVREPDTFQLYYAFSRSVQSVQLHSHVHLFATPWTTACQASLSISRSLLKLMSTELVMPSNHLIHCLLLLLLPSMIRLLIVCLPYGNISIQRAENVVSALLSVFTAVNTTSAQ